MKCHVFFTSGVLYLCLFFHKIALANLQPGYLDFDNLPDTNFSCVGKVIGGYYADLEANCQMFHVCTIGQLEEPMDIRFLCLNGTVFDQETRVCERVDEVDCANSEKFYSLNLELYGNTAPAIVEAPENKEPQISSTTTQASTNPPETTTVTSFRSTTVQPTVFVHQQTTPHSVAISSTADPGHFHNTDSHHFSHILDDINLDPETPPDVTYGSPPPVSFQHHTYNGDDAHITVTTHTSVYRPPLHPTPHIPTGHPGHNKPYGNQRHHVHHVNRPFLHHTQHHTETTKNEPHAAPPSPKDHQFHKFRPTHSNATGSFLSHRLSTTAAPPPPPPPPAPTGYNHYKTITVSHYREADDVKKQQQQQKKHDNIFNYKPENDPSDLRYHFFSTNSPQYLPQRLSLIQPTESDSEDESEEDDREDSVFRISHPHGHSIQEFGRIDPVPRGFQSEQIKEVASTLYQTTSHITPKTDKPPRVQLPLPLLPFNPPQPFVLRDHYETKRHQPNDHQLPRVIVSASATISDASGRKLNITLGTIGPTLADAIGKAPGSYDDYKEGDVGLDPFYHDVPKLKGGLAAAPKRKRGVDNNYFNTFDYVNDNYEAKQTDANYQFSSLDYVNDNYEPLTFGQREHDASIYIPLGETEKLHLSKENATVASGMPELVLEPAEKAIHGIENATKSKYVDNKMLGAESDTLNLVLNESHDRFAAEAEDASSEDSEEETVTEEFLINVTASSITNVTTNPPDSITARNTTAEANIAFTELNTMTTLTKENIQSEEVEPSTVRPKQFQQYNAPPIHVAPQLLKLQRRLPSENTERIETLSDGIKAEAATSHHLTGINIEEASASPANLSTTPDGTVPAPPPPPQQLAVQEAPPRTSFTCANQQVHNFYSDSRDCRLFHYCAPGFQNSEVLHLKFVCDIGTYFDIEKRKCTPHKPSRCL